MDIPCPSLCSLFIFFSISPLAMFSLCVLTFPKCSVLSRQLSFIPPCSHLKILWAWCDVRQLCCYVCVVSLPKSSSFHNKLVLKGPKDRMAPVVYWCPKLSGLHCHPWPHIKCCILLDAILTSGIQNELVPRTFCLAQACTRAHAMRTYFQILSNFYFLI